VKKFSLFLLMAVFLMFGARNVLAQSANEKIGFLDLSKVFDEYGKTKEYDKILEGKHGDYEKERNAKIEKLRAAQEKLAILKDEEKAKQEQEIEKQKTELLDYDRQKKTDLTKQRDEKIREILLEIEKVVKDYAEREKFSLILNDRVLIYGKPAWDVTNDILKTLNENFNKSAESKVK